MNDLNEDPELLDDPEEGSGDESAYNFDDIDNAPFDAEQFELPEDYEYDGGDEDA
jgi:hypothetical protein